MEWYKILIEIILGLGGLAGIGAFIKVFLFAKQERKGKDIENRAHEIDNVLKLAEVQQKTIEGLQKQLDDNHDFHQKQLQELEERYEKRFEETDRRTAFFKEKYEKMEVRLDIQDHAIAAAYRCTLPANIEDCPVIQHLKVSNKCEECRKRGADDCIDCKED